MNLTSLVIPLLIAGVAAFALFRKVDVFDALTKGASDGMRVVIKIFPSLVALLSAVYMLRASGAMEYFATLMSPLLERFGIPAETAALMIVRPISGSAALAVGSELIYEHGADSFIGRCAAVMLGSSETTFYTVAVYFGALGIKKTRHAIPAALTADFVAFVTSALAVRLFYQ